MAKDDIGGVWRTVGGRRIFIKDGEDLETAMKNSGKFSNKKDDKSEKEIEEEFKNSKVRDENGKLIKMYHGSPNENIQEFDIEKSGANTMSAEYGIFFTDSKTFADDFSYERIETDSMFFDKRGKKGKVYEAYLNIEKPLDFGKINDNEIKDLYKYASNIGKIDGEETFVNNMKNWQKIGNHQLMKGNLNLKSIANNSDYDGIIAKLEVQKDDKEYVVFKKKQIKLLK